MESNIDNKKETISEETPKTEEDKKETNKETTDLKKLITKVDNRVKTKVIKI
jgi:hypothetical protein